MLDLLFVALGGALGALSRYGVGLAAAHSLGKAFPWGTLIVNVAGCFVMGIVLDVMARLQTPLDAGLTASASTQFTFWHKAVAIGFLGGLTTFSSFGADTLREFQSGNLNIALANIFANLLLSLLAVWCGSSLMHFLR